jgi:hypothetical protein
LPGMNIWGYYTGPPSRLVEPLELVASTLFDQCG